MWGARGVYAWSVRTSAFGQFLDLFWGEAVEPLEEVVDLAASKKRRDARRKERGRAPRPPS